MKQEVRGEMMGVRLTNFRAEIVAEVTFDDGAELTREFELKVERDGRVRTVRMPASEFASLNWVLEKLGADYVIYAGFGKREHARTAIQVNSKSIQRRSIYAHSGWRKIGENFVYLHGGGAIGPDGQVDGVAVKLPHTLAPLNLPKAPTGPALADRVRMDLELLNLGPDEILVPLIGATYRAVLGKVDFGMHLSGQTGVFKSEVAALMQQHFGRGFDRINLPGNWSSTANALEGLAFAAKDMLLVVDDFAPRGSSYDRQRYQEKADRLFRAQGNSSARQRMRADATLRPSKPPRGLILSTGEEIPSGESLRARICILELSPGAIHRARLTEAQVRAAAGVYAETMSSYLRWLASNYENIQKQARLLLPKLRARATASDQHRRTPTLVADLFLGLHFFLRFALEVGAIDENEHSVLIDRIWTALGSVAVAQSKFQKASEPTQRFLELLRAAITSGRAHIADMDGNAPQNAAAFGWREFEVGTGDNWRSEWRPQGDRVGWVDFEKDDLFLEPEASYMAAQKMATESDGVPVSAQTLRKRLDEKHLLKTKEKGRGLMVRQMLQGVRQDVLHLDLSVLGEIKKQP